MYASDASGGPGAKDPRALCVAWAIAAYKFEAGVPRRVGSVTCIPEEPLSVAQAEQQAVFELFCRVEGHFDATVDCKAVTHILQKASPPLDGPVAWGTVWSERQRAAVHWVPSHKDASYFAEHNLPEWRRLVNEDVDKLCGARAAQAYASARRPNLRLIDQVCEDVCLHLARKVGHILSGKNHKSFPWVLQRRRSEGPDPSPYPALVLSNPVFDKSLSKVKTVAPNKKQRLKQLLEQQDPGMGHMWQASSTKAHATNFAIQCKVCRLYVEQCNGLDVFNRKVGNPCQDIPATLPACWVCHESRDLLNKGSFFTCSKCLAVVKIAASSTSKAIQEPCRGLARRINSGLNAKAHAKVAAKQNHSLSDVFAKQSLPGRPPAESALQLQVVPASQAASEAKVLAKAKAKAAKAKSRLNEPRQKVLFFK